MKNSTALVAKAKTPKSKLTFITPTMAKEMLKLNTKNRTISQASVVKFAKLITEGRFIITNQGIGIDVNNVLADGQHRLHAIIKANKGVNMFVMTDLEPKSRLVVDVQTVRTPANSLDVYGLSKVAGDKKNYSKLLASVSAYIILHNNNNFKAVQAFGKYLSNEDIVNFVNTNHSELLNSVKTVLSLSNDSSKKYVTDSHAFFIYQMHKFFNKERISNFIDIVYGNKISETPDTCPATKLKNALIKNSVIKFGTKFNTKDLLGLWIDASNKYMAGEEMKAKARLTGRPNSAALVNVKFSGELNDEAVKFFNSASLTGETA